MSTFSIMFSLIGFIAYAVVALRIFLDLHLTGERAPLATALAWPLVITWLFLAALVDPSDNSG